MAEGRSAQDRIDSRGCMILMMQILGGAALSLISVLVLIAILPESFSILGGLHLLLAVLVSTIAAVMLVGWIFRQHGSFWITALGAALGIMFIIAIRLLIRAENPGGLVGTSVVQVPMMAALFYQASARQLANRPPPNEVKS